MWDAYKDVVKPYVPRRDRLTVLERVDAQGAIDSAYDPYAFVRNVYLQHRAFKVNGGQSTDEEQQEQKLLEESEQDMSEGTAAPPQAPPPQAPPPH